MNNSDNKVVKISGFISLISSLLILIFGLLFSGFFLIFGIIRGADLFTKIVCIPFFICGLSVIIRGLSLFLQAVNMLKSLNSMENYNFSNVDKNEVIQEKLIKIANWSNNIYIFGFLLFWFGFLIFFDYTAIKDWENGGNMLFFFSLIFWIVGFFVAFIKFKKKK